MRAALMPAAIACPGATDVGQLQASPLRQRSAALAGELPRQHGLLTFLVGADDMRTKLAMSALVDAGHLLSGENSLAEQYVGPARHRFLQIASSGPVER